MTTDPVMPRPLQAGKLRISMARPMVDPAVLRRFSAGAARYEAHAHVQRLSAGDLLAHTKEWLPTAWGRDDQGWPGAVTGDRFTILEPGCGTGLYTRMLLDAFPAASILGVDISEAMIRVARKGVDDLRARFAVADAEEIATGRYDLVTSNAAFQWFLSFPRTLARMASFLPGGGMLTFSFFGPETFAELDDALRAASDGHGKPGVAAAAFHSREEISDALSGTFSRWDVVERRYHQEFATLADLLRSIRYTGTRGNGARESWSPGKLARVEEGYRERAGGIKATYQVFLCRAVTGDGQGRPSAAAGKDAPDFVAAADGQGRPSAVAGKDAPDFVAAADGQGRPSAAAGRGDARDLVVAPGESE